VVLLAAAGSRSPSSAQPWTCEFRIILTDGTIKWIAGASNPYVENDGRNFWYGFMNDVTDQKQISHKLENLANSIPNGFLYEYQISRDGTIYKLNQVSQGVEVLFEVNMAAALANVDSLFSKIHPEDLPRFSEVVEKYRKEPGKFEVDYRIVMEDGRIKWVRGIANVRIILNQVTLIEGIALDITHQKALEQEELISKVKLEQSENYLRAILNASTDSTVFTDREGRVRVANAMGLKRIQSMYNKPFVLGDYFEDTLPPRYREDFRSYFTRAMGGEVIEFERKVEVPGSDGSRWIHARYLPVSDKQNQVIGVSQNVTDITDRREAELALERSEHDLRAILNAATESTFYIDPDGKMRVANVKAHKKVKELFDKEIKIGEKFISLLPEALCDRFLMNFNKALAGEAVHLEGDFAFGEGKSIWLSLSYLPVKSGSGEVTGVSFNAADITERKITEQALKQSEERFKSLYHNTPAMLYSIDATGNLIRVSDYWLHKMGYTREEVLGKSVADFLTEESKQKALEIYLPEYQRSGKITNAEYQFITKDGQVLETLLSASSEFENGVPAKSMTVVTDISEMKKLEREVDKLGLIASRTSNAVILTDAHQRITWVNEGFERLTEYSFQEAVGKNPNFLQGAETDANTIQKMSSALSNGEGFREEVLNYSKSGKKYWLDIEVMPIRNNHKELVGFMAIESDITNLKRAVHEMIRSEQTLQAFMDFAPLVAFIKDLDGRYMFYNKTYQNFMKDKELRAGSTDYEIFDKDFADSCRQRDQLVATSGDVIQFEHTVGKQTFMEYKFPLRDMHGVMYSIGGISIDITERKQSEEALKQSEAYLKSVFENSDTAFVLMDLDLRILSFNHMAQQTIYSLLKVSIQVGDLALSFTPENRKEIILPLFKEALEGKTAEYESLFKLNDETEMWIHGRFFPVVNNGKVSGVIYAMNDITLRKMAEAEILQSRERLQVIGDNLPSVAIYQYEVRPGEFDGRYTYYSSGVMQITGISQEALLFNPSLFENQIHGDDRVVKKAKVIEALSMNTVYDQEYRFHHQEKGWRWIRNRSQFSRLADGRIIWNGLIIDITERKEAELELKESEGRFRAMADYAPVLVWMSAPDKLCNYFNKGWLDFTGRTIEEEMGNGWAAGVHPDDLNRCVDIYERNFDQRKRFQMEYRLRRHDGEYRWIVDHGVPRYLPDGEFVGYIGSCFDIHDLVETRQKLSDNELRLRTILETEPECVKILNLRGELLEMNPAGLNMIEAENFEQVKGHEMATLVHENYRASFTKLTREVFRGSSGILEFQMTSLKGTPRWLETHAVPMRDARGNINSLLGVTRDISHRKETENTLRESEERYRLLFDLNPVPTWIYDLNDFRFLRVNKAAMDHYGYSAAEFMNMSILDIRPEQERERVIDTVNFLRKSNEGLIQHPRYWKHKKKDNTLIDVEVLSTGFKYENKEARLVTVNDVTEKLRGENELIGALKDKDLLIKEIHHRVKNNLQLISSILYIRMAGMKHSEMKIFLEETRQKIRSIALIHERLLQTESVNQVDICDYLNKLILDLQMTTLSHEKKIQLHADIQPANMSLDMAINCGLILNELITNSAKHAFQDNNGGTIKVSLKQNGDKFEFVVEDDGIGLPDTIQLGSGGFGMQVLDVFVKQLKAYVEIKRNPGTTYKLIF
jgi:PAS domain S-box-containing protein